MPRHDLYLPSEIWTQIITNLPVKSVLRCRCVCKTWYSLVSSPTFISDHAARTLNQSTGDRVLVDRRLTGISIFTFRDKLLVESHEQHRRPGVRIVGSCNGLICLSRYDYRVIGSDDSFLIWNPSIRKLVELPLLLYPPFSDSLDYLLGFGFDSESQDYKVVRVVYDNMDGNVNGDGPVWTKIDIFDLRTGAWRSSSSLMRPSYVFHTCGSVNLYGNLHWIGFDEASGNYILVCFNLSTEVLHEMEVGPEAAKDDDYIESYAKVVPINGLLSLAVDKYMDQIGGVRECYVSVWSMKEYGVTESWTKLFNIQLPSTMNLDSLHRFWENGEILLVERVAGNEGGSYVLALYNYESKTSKALLSCEDDFFGVFFY